MSKYSYEKKDNTYLTPYTLIQKALQLLSLEKGNVLTQDKFDLDVCCSNENIPAIKHYKHPEHDGLKEKWEK